MKTCKRFFAVLLCMLTICMILPMQAFAAGVIDLDRDVHLTLSCQHEGTLLSGAKFDLHLVATVDRYGRFTVTDEFSQFNVDIKGKNDEAWRKLASALEGFVLRDKIKPRDSGKTDSEGILSFPTGDQTLTPGLYLVVGYRHTQDGYYYDAAPFMVMLPGADHEKNDWAYDVTANVKFEPTKKPSGSGDSGGSDTINRKVLKVWEDEGHEDKRPNEIIVQLLRDGDVYDTVTLNAKNNWRHTWTGLDNKYKWTVVEKELEHYSVGLTREGTTFVLTNTYTEVIPDEPTPGNPAPGADTPDDPTPTSPGDPGSPAQPSEPKLPQTGQLWWPVPILVTAGMLCIVIGLIRRRGITDEG